MRAVTTPSVQLSQVRGTEDALDLHATWGKLVRNRWLVLGVMLLVVASTAYFTANQAPVYQSSATMRIDDRAQSPLAEMGTRSLIGGSGLVETEILVLQSRTLAERVAQQLQMNLRMQSAALSRQDVFSGFQVPANAPAGIYEMQRQDDASYRVSAVEGDVRPQPEQVRPGESFSIGNAVLTVSPALAQNVVPVARFSLAPLPAGVSDVRSGLIVNRPDARAQLISLTFSHTDRQLAADVPNTLMDAFIAMRGQEAKFESQTAVRFLRDQVGHYQTELAAAERNLGGFRQSERVVSLEEEAASNVSRLAELQAERDGLQSERDALGALLTRLTSNRDPNDTSSYRELASFPVFLANAAVQNILSNLTEYENEQARQGAAGRLGEYADISAGGAQQRIRTLELEILRLAQNYLQNLDNKIASTNALLTQFDAELTEIPAREMETARLVREQSLISDIYSLLQTRLMEAELQEAVDAVNVHPVDPGLVPDFPISPRPMRNMLFAVFIGLVLGIGAALGKEALDTKVHSKEDVQSVTGGIPVLGIIPSLDLVPVNGDRIRRRLGRAREIPKLERLVTRINPLSPASEAYRMLRTSVTFANMGQKAQVLVITSAMPGDGKSTSSANLAMTLAQQGVRTLLIDADLRKGVLHEILGASREPGLAHLLIGSTTQERAITEVTTGNGSEVLHFLPGGAYPPNPAELLGSDEMRSLLAEFRSSYDMVIIDAPPLNLVTDASVLGTAADATILVARAGVTEKRALSHAASQLGHLHARISGIVLNDLDVKRSGYGGDYYAYGYSNGNGDGH